MNLDLRLSRFDRIVAILVQLQARRVVRAQDLADRYGVNVRTIYRDLRTLEAAGVPLAGEAGVGFSLADGYRLPPVMLTRDEVMALLTADKLAEQFTDASTAQLSQAALAKLRAVLRGPDRDFAADVAPHIAVQPWLGRPPAAPPAQRALLMTSLASRQLLRLEYRADQQPATRRDVEPIGVYFDLHWQLVAFCRLRQSLRTFRFDRMAGLQLLEERFAPRPETLQGYLEAQREQQRRHPATVRFTRPGLARVRDDKYQFGWVAERETGAEMVEMDFLVPALRPLAYWLLYFGEQATVVSPPALRQELLDLAQAALRHHSAARPAEHPAA